MIDFLGTLLLGGSRGGVKQGGGAKGNGVNDSLEMHFDGNLEEIRYCVVVLPWCF